MPVRQSGSSARAGQGLFECVPNFSVGPGDEVLGELVQLARTTAGIAVLDHSQDADHGRAVLTFAGAAGPVEELALGLVERAAQRLDLNRHRGVHPRLGTTDVLPFIPLSWADRQTAVDLAHGVGARIGRELGIPVYFYGEAALRPERRLLADVRRGGFETLREVLEHNARPGPLADPARIPDEGPRTALHPTAGATAVGVRPFLIAFNVNLETDRLDVAREIAGLVRERNGGLPGLRALGFPLASRKMVQVSMNVTDHQRAPLTVIFDHVQRLARERGVAVRESELIGLAPAAALDRGIAEHIRLSAFDPDRHILEKRLENLLAAGGTGDPCDPGPSLPGSSSSNASDCDSPGLASPLDPARLPPEPRQPHDSV